MTHFLKRCECGRVLSQCRCIGLKTETTVSPCRCEETLRTDSDRNTAEKVYIAVMTEVRILMRRIEQEIVMDARGVSWAQVERLRAVRDHLVCAVQPTEGKP